MWCRRIALCLTFVLPLGLLSLAPLARAQTEAELDEARAAFREGVAFTQEERWAEAVPRFRAVLEVRDTAAVRYNLGLALVNSGEVREGVAYLRGVQNDPSLDDESRADARAEVERIQAEGISDAPPPEEDSAQPPDEELGADDADAAPTGPRPYQLDLHAGVSFFGFGLATGARFGIPLLHEGLLPDFEDALYFNVGFDFYFVQNRRNRFNGSHAYGGALGLPFTVQWQVYLDANWTVFAELGAQVFLHPRLFDDGTGDPLEPGYFVVAAAGIGYRIADILQLTLRVGTPYASLGLTVEF
ncbi:MAG: hypothetical protein AB8I08_14080 [Sandaracinaceae bacterium]